MFVNKFSRNTVGGDDSSSQGAEASPPRRYPGTTLTLFQPLNDNIGDPDPHPDPYVFRPPGSVFGSLSH